MGLMGFFFVQFCLVRLGFAWLAWWCSACVIIRFELIGSGCTGFLESPRKCFPSFSFLFLSLSLSLCLSLSVSKERAKGSRAKKKKKKKIGVRTVNGPCHSWWHSTSKMRPRGEKKARKRMRLLPHTHTPRPTPRRLGPPTGAAHHRPPRRVCHSRNSPSAPRRNGP